MITSVAVSELNAFNSFVDFGKNFLGNHVLSDIMELAVELLESYRFQELTRALRGISFTAI